MHNTIRRLPDAEQEVMQALLACKSPAARTDIEEILFQTHPMAMTTLLTLLTRLSEKGFVRIEKRGRRSYYTPCITQEEYLASQDVRDVLGVSSSDRVTFIVEVNTVRIVNSAVYAMQMLHMLYSCK